jgi:signal transduction histidine kinase
LSNSKIRRVNEPETFDHTPINSHSADFQELDHVLNQMMDRISEQFKKEKQFIANVSHELLTPIALLKNKFENLLQNESLNDEAVDKIAGALKTLDMLKKVIGNLLLISRIENHQYEANESIDCYELLEELAADLEDRIEARGIKFTNALQQRYHFKGNATLLRILLYNVLVNAIKYNKDGGEITISDTLGNPYALSITDTGMGMDQLQLSKIFKRFTRINEDKEGHGLGLAIADSIASFHNITIKVTSSPASGTTFTLVFPKAN